MSVHLPPGDAEWRKQLARSKSSKIPYGDERNVMLALQLAPELVGRLQYDEFADQIDVLAPFPWHAARGLKAEWWPGKQRWSDPDRIELQVWLQSVNLPVSRASVVQDSVIAVAHRRAVHPVREYFVSLANRWDGKKRLDGWLRRYLRATDNAYYLEQVGPAFLIGAVRRIMQPGTKQDCILVLEGSQGARKTSTVQVLSRGWCRDISNDLHSREAAMLIQGVFMAELAELTAIARSQIEAVKGFISRTTDSYRPPYGRNVVERPRQTVFIGTTNECEYLQDLTGNRRYWPVECGEIDLEALDRDADQLWAEAFAESLTPRPHWLDKTAELFAWREQQYRRRISPLEIDVLEFADRRRTQGDVRLDIRHVALEILKPEGGVLSPRDGATVRDISRVLTANGWRRFRPRGRGANRVVVYEYVAERDPSRLAEEALKRFEEGSQDAS